MRMSSKLMKFLTHLVKVTPLCRLQCDCVVDDHLPTNIFKKTTTESTMSVPLPKFYNAWFCPFAQRAWIALLEKGVEFEYIEQDPYDKTPEWLAVNPRGLVPAIVHKGKSVYESSICIEYIDEEWETGKDLLPKDAYQRARVRILSDQIGKKVVPPLYALLMKKSEQERTTAKQEIESSLKSLFEGMENQDGPFFGGKTLNMVDVMLFPFAYRFQVLLPVYRGYTPPMEGLEQYYKWYAAACEYDSVKKTLPDTNKLIESYKRYAEDTAKSAVAEAIRKGTALP